MTIRELKDALAALEFISSVLTLQLLLQSRVDSDSEFLLEDDERGQRSLEERLALMEERLCRLERYLRIR